MQHVLRSSARLGPSSALCGALLTLCCALFPSPARSGSFQSVGPLTEARWEAPALLLADGSALIVGGYTVGTDRDLGVASAERFDAKTNRFSIAGRLRQGRASHAIARLRDGRVLAVGGVSAVGDPRYILLDGEVFDPATGSSAAVGKISLLRANPTATLLPNGEVLVAGGWSSLAIGGPTPTAEIFDPTTGQFRKTDSMLAARYRHAAVTLPDGRVLLLGGRGARNVTVRQVEVYDPQSGAFSPAGELLEGRTNLRADLLPDGRVLVSGGQVHTSGGDVLSNALEIYDPATGKTAVAVRFPDPMIDHIQAVLPDGRVLFAGGIRTLGEVGPEDLLPARLFHPATGEISLVGTTVTPRGVSSSVLLPDGRVLIAGGLGFEGVLNAAEVYVP
jgi:hypothetical protein